MKTGATPGYKGGIWSQDEHDRFLCAMQRFPNGPWKAVADMVQTRSVRQVQTHAQKYQEKVARRLRGLRKTKKKLIRPEHRLDEATIELCQLVDEAAAQLNTSSPITLINAAHLNTSSPITLIKSEDGRKDTYQPSQDAAVVDLTPLSYSMHVTNTTSGHLPSLTESLDFLIDFLSTE